MGRGRDMTRTLITEVIVGSMATLVLWYVFPAVSYAQAQPQAGDLPLILSTLMVALGAYALIAIYCFATIAERVVCLTYDVATAYIKKQRSGYL